MEIRRCIFVVTACEGRELTSAATLAALEHHGGGHLCPVKELHWTGPTAPPFEHPGFELVWFPGYRGNSRAALFRTIAHATRRHPGYDVVIVEDDVSPARNAMAYVQSWQRPTFTTFFNTRGWPLGIHQLDASGFWGLQCVRIPAELAARLGAEDPNADAWLRNPSNPTVMMPGLHGGDFSIGRMLRAWGEPVYQHRTLFQHVGAQSLCEPKATLKGIRVARDFVGEDFDCLTAEYLRDGR